MRRALNTKFQRRINIPELSPTEHGRVVEETRKAQSAINLGACPNDGATMVDGWCPALGCRFRIIVAPPPIIDQRVPFNRQWWRRPGGVPN